jgi:hypothetical protein
MASLSWVGMLVLLLISSAAADLDVQVSVDWNSEIIRTRTAVRTYMCPPSCSRENDLLWHKP